MTESRSSVHSGRFVGRLALAVVKARVETTRNGEATAQDIVNVLAVCSSIRSILACSKTEVVGRHEACPLVGLLVLAEGVREDESSLGVAQTGPRVRVKLSAIVIGYEAHLCQIA